MAAAAGHADSDLGQETLMKSTRTLREESLLGNSMKWRGSSPYHLVSN